MMGELTVWVCSLASVVLVGMVLVVAIVASWERPMVRLQLKRPQALD